MKPKPKLKLDLSWTIRDLLCTSELTGVKQRDRIWELLAPDKNRWGNRQRAESVLPYFEDYMNNHEKGEPISDGATDFLTNVLHLFTHLGLDVDALVERAQGHHSTEISDEIEERAYDAALLNATEVARRYAP